MTMHVQPMSIKSESLLPQEVAQRMSNRAVGERLRRLRVALGLTPSEISDYLGIERTYWSRFEKGRQGLSDPVAALLTIRFGVTLDYLILGDASNLSVSLSEKIRAVDPE